MNKFFGIIAAAAIALAPMSASALEALTDNALNSVTGQAGVTIAADDIVLETWIGETRYTDTDGTDGIAGSLVISNQHTVQTLQGISSSTDPGTFTTLHSVGVELTKTSLDAAALAGMGGAFIAQGLIIDVGTCAIYSAGASYNATLAAGGTPTTLTMAGVVIGLPTLELNTSSDTYTVGIAETGAYNDG